MGLHPWRLTDAHWFDAAPLFLHSTLWTAVVVLSGLAVLRARECYADVQASVWDQASRIDHVLATLSAPVREGWRRYFRFHPDPRERRQFVEDPSRLLGLGFADAFGIGIAAWSIVDVVGAVLLPFFPADQWAAVVFYWSIQFIVPAVVFVFAIGAIGIGVWRSAFASMVQGDHPSKGTGWLGLAFVAGSFPGVIVSLAEAGLQSFREPSIPFSVALTNLQLNVLIYIVLLLGCLLIFRWISTAASAWFEVVLQSRSPRPILLITVATATILVLGTLTVATFIVLFSFLTVSGQGSHESQIYQYGLLAGAPLLVALLTAWAFPLAALWWREASMPTGFARWVFLDNSSPEFPEQPPLRARGALLTGIVTGLICWLLWELAYLRSYFPTGISNGIASAFSWLVAWTSHVFGNKGFVISGTAVIFQALAAAIAAGRARRLSTICGLFAASVAGFIIVVGNNILFGFRPESQLWNQTLVSLQLMGLGAFITLPTALVAGWVGNLARRAFPSICPSPPHSP